MISIEYDELTDEFRYVCHECGKSGPDRDRERDADLDGTNHEGVCTAI